LTIQADFDITITGFEVPEIDLILQLGDVPDEEYPIDAARTGPAVSELGDLWALGDPRIFCGNSLLEASFSSLLSGKQADMMLADPPYGVSIDGHATGNGATKRLDVDSTKSKKRENSQLSSMDRVPRIAGTRFPVHAEHLQTIPTGPSLRPLLDERIGDLSLVENCSHRLRSRLLQARQSSLAGSEAYIGMALLERQQGRVTEKLSILRRIASITSVFNRRRCPPRDQCIYSG
jgi:hypothetical protein